MATKAYIAKTDVDLEMLIGNFIDDLVFTILDEDAVAFDFSAAVGGDGFYLRIYLNGASNNRVLKDTLSETGGDITETGGVITVSTAFPTAVLIGRYHYELDYNDSDGLKRLANGALVVI
jgi:hypothetical protein